MNDIGKSELERAAETMLEKISNLIDAKIALAKGFTLVEGKLPPFRLEPDLASASAEGGEDTVTESCGCVFCDMNLKPDLDQFDVPTHYVEQGHTVTKIHCLASTAPAHAAPEGGGDWCDGLADDLEAAGMMLGRPGRAAPAHAAPEAGGESIAFNWQDATECVLSRLAYPASYDDPAFNRITDTKTVLEALRAANARIAELERGDEQRVRDLTKWIERAEKAEAERDAALRDAAALREAMELALKAWGNYDHTQSERLVSVQSILTASLSAPASGGTLTPKEKNDG